jgi:hypothetical protein
VCWHRKFGRPPGVRRLEDYAPPISGKRLAAERAAATVDAEVALCMAGWPAELADLLQCWAAALRA